MTDSLGATRIVRFLVWGLPAFVVSLLLNTLLTTTLGWPKPVSYLVALYVQLSINYFVCRRIVFDSDPDAPMLRQYAQFMAGVAFFRLLDWGLYSLLVAFIPFFTVYYQAAQILNVILFSVLRFRFSESLFEKKKFEKKNELRAPEGSSTSGSASRGR